MLGFVPYRKLILERVEPCMERFRSGYAEHQSKGPYRTEELPPSDPSEIERVRCRSLYSYIYT